jgi:hypothetical protein
MTSSSSLLQRAVDALEPVYGSTTSHNSHADVSQPSGDESPSISISPSPPAATLPLYQTQLVDSFMRSPGNEVLFLPTGLGECNVVDEIARQMLQRFPDKHVALCVVRPAQALSHADRLRAALGVPVGAFCGGDFLYDFEEEFKKNKVVVFTAGLLMRLAKLGTYKLEWASLLVLHDAFSAVRNHPMNTLVREYYWKGPAAEAGADKPRILGVVLPQLQQLQRPFDKLRQLVRKLCHSAQAGVLVPTGPALETLAQRVHRAHVAMHGYDLTPLERQLGEALQTHSLLVWDTLHAFGQNHFGRLIHFPPSASPQQSPRTTVGGVGVDSQQQQQPAVAQPLPPSHAARLAAQLALSQGGAGSPASSSSPAALGSPASNLGSPSQADTPPQKTAAPGSVAPPNAAPYAFDPVHHDWRQIELMVRHSIACSEALPSPGDSSAAAVGKEEEGGGRESEEAKHPRSDVAVAVMHHVLRCAQAIQTGMELGVGPCLAQLLPALIEFKDALDAFSKKFSKEKEEAGGDTEGGATSDDKKNTTSSGSSVDEQLLSKILFVLPTSPLLQWLSMNGGRKELSTMMGSRMGSLLDVLEEVLRHNEAEGLFRSYMNTNTGSGDDGGGTAAGSVATVAVVVGNEQSGNAVKGAIESAPELNGTIISRWKGATATTVEEKKEEKAESIKKAQKGTLEDTHLSIHLLTSDEATSPKGRAFISQCNEAVWFSASDVLHAAGFDFESAALGICCRISAVGNVNSYSSSSSDTYLPGPECHVLATGAQTAAWLEVCRADQLLLAAMQLVQAGDASFEGYLGQMMTNPSHRGTWENMSVPPPAAVLHTLCLGLCGTPPHFQISKDHDHSEAKKVVFQAAVVLPEGLLAPGNYALPVAFGSEEISFQGPLEDSEAEARDAAAEVALAALVECGLVAAYWQTRALLVQSQQVAAAAVADLSEKMQQHSLVVSGPAPGVMPPSPFVDAAARSSSPTRRPGGGGGGSNEGLINNVPVPSDRLICPICGIVTTSEGHLKEHLAGRRHLKNLERLQQQQTGATTGPARFAANAAAAAAVSEHDNKEGTDGATTTSEAGGKNKNEPLTPPRRTASGLGGSSSATPAEGATTPPPQLTTLSTIDRLPSSLSDAFLRRSSSLHRHSSGNVYEGFPCVRVGDVILPSSMDLRAFLDEMQQAGELDLPSAGGSGTASLLGLAAGIAGCGTLDSLPSIDETTTGRGSKHVTTPIASNNTSTSATTGAKKEAISSSSSRVPALSIRSYGGGAGSGGCGSNVSAGAPRGGSNAGATTDNSSSSYNRSGRPPPAPRPGSNAYRSGGGGGGGGGYTQYSGQQQQHQNQQQRNWNTNSGMNPSSNRDRQRYPSRFAQDAAHSGNSGGGGGGEGALGGGGGFPAGMMAYQAYPHHPHAVHHHPHPHHGQHIMQQPIAFIPAGLGMAAYHPAAVASPTGMASIGMMALPGGSPGGVNVAMGHGGSPGGVAPLMSQGSGGLPAGAYFQAPVPQHHHHHHQQYPGPQHHQYSYQPQHGGQYYGVRPPMQQQQPQQRGGGGAPPSWRQQQQQQ